MERQFGIGPRLRPVLGRLSAAERARFGEELAKIEVASGIFKAVADVIRVDTSYGGLMRRVRDATRAAIGMPARLLLALAVLYLALLSFPLYGQGLMVAAQWEIYKWILVALLLTFTAGSVIHVHFFGVSRRGLPDLDELLATDCDALEEDCRSLCLELKEEMSKLEATGRLRSPRRIAQGLGIYSLGVAGIIYSLTTPGGWVGAAVGLPGVLIWVDDLRRQNRLGVQYLKRWAEEVAALWERFRTTCLAQ